MKVICVKNGKGGDGKTVFSLNLAALLAKEGKVLLIDTDPRCHSSNFMIKNENVPVTGTIEKGNLGEWITGKKSADKVIRKSAFSNLDFIACSDDLDDYVKELEKKRIMSMAGRNLKECIEVIEGRYDYVVIDCSQNVTTIDVNVLVASDFALIPVKCGLSSMDGCFEMLDWIEQVQTLNPDLDYKIVMNDREKNKEAEEIENKARGLWNDKVCKTTIRHQSKPLTKSIRTGIPVVYEHRTPSEVKRTTIADDFINLVKELTQYGC